MPAWQFRALGPADLHDLAEGSTLYPERKTAALLLSLEGPTSRSRLAGLLWPDSSESAARNNLSQTLRRLRLTTGQALILGDDTLRLSPELSVDAALLKVALFTGEAEAEARGSLLANYDYDDCPTWPTGSTAKPRRSRRPGTSSSRRDEAEAKGDLSRAIALGEKLLEHDPLSESAYRQLMRLYYQAGDRGAALRVYQRCREALARELGVLPLPESDPTRALAMLREAAELAETLALPLELWRANCELSRCLARLRRVQEAETALSHARALSDELAQAPSGALPGGPEGADERVGRGA